MITIRKTGSFRGAREMSYATSAKKESGATLLIGMLLLVIVSIMTVFAVNVGVFEQRASGNEYRAKEAFQAGESGINAGLEYLKQNQRTMFASDGWVASGYWTACTGTPAAGDPCAHVGPTLDGLAGPIYKYQNGSNTALPIPATMMNIGADFGAYNVTALLCFYSADDDDCKLSSQADEIDDTTVQLVSFGSSDDTLGQSSISVTVAPYENINTNLPAPIVVAGNFVGTGTYDIVANPDGAGDGVPLSVWSSDDVTASTNDNARTCNFDEFLHTNQGGSAPSPEVVDGVTICTNCACPDERDAQWSPITEGSDILSGFTDDIVQNDPDFPDDLFSYVFGVDSSDYLNVKTSLPGEILTSCSSLDGDSSGIIWVVGGCSINQEVGSPADPVFLISACGDFEVTGNIELFGLFYIDDIDEDCSGGTSRAKMRGGTQIYGAVIVDTDIEQGTGNGAVIYSNEVLENLGDGDKPWGPLPGSWYDFP